MVSSFRWMLDRSLRSRGSVHLQQSECFLVVRTACQALWRTVRRRPRFRCWQAEEVGLG